MERGICVQRRHLSASQEYNMRDHLKPNTAQQIMTDYIFFHPDKEDVNVYAVDLVAFFPDDGFVMFEGYSHMRESTYPFTLKINRREPRSRFVSYYTIKVTGGHKKHIQLPPREKPTVCCDPDEDDSCISFFSRDLIILKFTILEAVTDAPEGYDWRFCIDDRYETPQALLEMYESLVELPESVCGDFDPNPAHEPFYVEYHRLRERNLDIFRADRELSRFTRQEPLEKFRELYESPAEEDLKESATS
jgi:hypothetical protein